MSWALSSLQLRKYYDNVELYTDVNGYKFLIEELKLPYSKIHVTFDELNHYHKELWALPKIKSYGMQNEPFLHIDGDVYIWEPFDQNLLLSRFIAQNIEKATEHYGSIWRVLEEKLLFIPEVIFDERFRNEPFLAYNAGVLGGYDNNFFKQYAKEAFEFVDKNASILLEFQFPFVTNFNIFYEQYLFYCLLKKEKLEANCIFDEIIYDNGYKELGNFEDAPYSQKFIHLIGSFKRHLPTCNLLERRLRQDYPEYYFRILKLFKSNDLHFFQGNIPLSEELLLLEKSYINGLLTKHNPIQEKEDKSIKIDDVFKYSIFVLNIFNTEENSEFKTNALSISSIRHKVEKLNNKNLINLFAYELSIFNVLNIFSKYSKKYLYARDVISNRYFEMIFGTSFDVSLEKIIVKDDLIQVISSSGDWCTNQLNEDILAKINSQVNISEMTYVIVIPEADDSLCNKIVADNFDLLILKYIEQPKSIGVLLKELMLVFEESDLQKSLPEFHKLVFGRIKNMIYNKCIRIVLKNC